MRLKTPAGLVLALISLTSLRPGEACSHYVAPDGAPSGNGTFDRPWDLQTALNQPPVVHAGETIWLRGGIYRASTPEGFDSRLMGTATTPFIVRNYGGERAIIDGNGVEYALAIHGQYTWFWGLEITDSSGKRNSATADAHPNAWGVAVYGPGTKCINLIVHDTAQGFSAYDSSPDSEFYGNLVYYNGYIAPDRQHGHGLYLQNVKGMKIVADNIVGDNFDEGIQIYGSANAHVTGFRVEGNTMYNSSSFKGANYQYNLLIAGGALRSDIQVRGNYSYLNPERDYGFVTLGDYTAGLDMLVQDNVFAGGYTGVTVNGQAGPVTFTGNTVYVRPSAVQCINLRLLPGQTLAGYRWDNNTYIGLDRFFHLINRDFAQWRIATGFDTGSKFVGKGPTGVWTYVRPNKFEPHRANITIYNWDGLKDVPVDLSGVLQPGDNFMIKDAQNFFAPEVMSGVFQGDLINISMTGLSKALPMGIAPPEHTGPVFGTFILLPVKAQEISDRARRRGSGTPPRRRRP